MDAMHEGNGRQGHEKQKNKGRPVPRLLSSDRIMVGIQQMCSISATRRNVLMNPRTVTNIILYKCKYPFNKTAQPENSYSEGRLNRATAPETCRTDKVGILQQDLSVTGFDGWTFLTLLCITEIAIQFYYFMHFREIFLIQSLKSKNASGPASCKTIIELQSGTNFRLCIALASYIY